MQPSDSHCLPSDAMWCQAPKPGRVVPVPIIRWWKDFRGKGGFIRVYSFRTPLPGWSCFGTIGGVTAYILVMVKYEEHDKPPAVYFWPRIPRE